MRHSVVAPEQHGQELRAQPHTRTNDMRQVHRAADAVRVAMVRSVLQAVVWLPEGLHHYVVRQKVDGTPDGEDVVRVTFGCGRMKTYRKDPHVSRNLITCVGCLVRWLHDDVIA
jgi:hypothetical protein